jgi:hypothetical protein
MKYNLIMGLGKLIKEKWDHIRYPYRYCSVCKIELQDDTRYRCRYCGKYTCPEHRPTPNHKCRINREKINFGSFRELHGADGSIVAKGS